MPKKVITLDSDDAARAMFLSLAHWIRIIIYFSTPSKKIIHVTKKKNYTCILITNILIIII